jgi:hypothetical protein
VFAEIATEDHMTVNAMQATAYWQELVKLATDVVENDIGTSNLNAEDLAFELAVTSHYLAGHSAEGGGELEEEYKDLALLYLSRSFVIAQKVFSPPTPSYERFWMRLSLAHQHASLLQTTRALINLDNAMLEVNALSGKNFEPYGTYSTVYFLIGKYKQRLSLERRPESEVARLLELDAVLCGACNACRQVGLDMRALGEELTPLFTDLYETNVPSIDKVEVLERAFRPT